MRERAIDAKAHRVTEYPTLEAFLTAGVTPPGINTVMNGGLPIDVLNVPASRDITVVFLHGAMEGSVRVPVLTGQGVSAGLEANRVFVSDPSLMLDDKLALAWYAGNQSQPQLQDSLVSIIEKIVVDHKSSRVVFFGGSGGGFAALYLATRIPNALALVFNPQTNIARYNSQWVRAFTHRAFQIDTYEYDPLRMLPHTVTTNLVPIYSQPVSAKVAYMQNLRDQSHVLRHVRPFCDALQTDNDVYMLVQAWNAGHTPPPKAQLVDALHRVTTIPNWDLALAEAGFVPLDAQLAANIAARGVDFEVSAFE